MLCSKCSLKFLVWDREILSRLGGRAFFTWTCWQDMCFETIKPQVQCHCPLVNFSTSKACSDQGLGAFSRGRSTSLLAVHRHMLSSEALTDVLKLQVAPTQQIP